jgi:hypothetical protein
MAHPVGALAALHQAISNPAPVQAALIDPAAAQVVAADPANAAAVLADPAAAQAAVAQAPDPAAAGQFVAAVIANPANSLAVLVDPAQAAQAAQAAAIPANVQAMAAQVAVPPQQPGPAPRSVPVRPPYVMPRAAIRHDVPLADRIGAVDAIRNLTITPAIIAESIQTEAEFLTGHNIVNIPNSGYETILTELILLRISLIIGGVYLTINSGHFTDMADLPAQVSTQDYRRRLRILENQSEGLIENARRHGYNIRVDMIIKYRRDVFTETLIAEQMFNTYQKIKYGQHIEQPTSYGPYIEGLRTIINTLFAGGAGAAEGNAFFVSFLQMITLQPVSVHSNTIKLKLREIEATACLYAYCLTNSPGSNLLDQAQLVRILRSFTETPDRMRALGINAIRADLAASVGVNPFMYVLDRTILDIGRFTYRMLNTSRIGLAALFNSLYTVLDGIDNPIPYEPALVAEIERAIGGYLYNDVEDDQSRGGLLIMDEIENVINPATGERITVVHLGGATVSDEYRMINGYAPPNGKIGIHPHLINYISELCKNSMKGPTAYIPMIPGVVGSTSYVNPYYQINKKFVEACNKYVKQHDNSNMWKLSVEPQNTQARKNSFKQTHQPTSVNTRRNSSVNISKKSRSNIIRTMRRLSGGFRTRRRKNTRKNHKRSRRH